MTRTIRLNDLQLVLLSGAAARDNGSLIPLPSSCTQDSSAVAKAAAALMHQGFVEELPVTDRSLAWREQDQAMIGLFITDAGRTAIGADEDAGADGNDENAGEVASDKTDPVPLEQTEPASSSPPQPGSKIATVVALLEREGGATLDELVKATGWLPHTTRAALTGLRKKG